MKIVFTPDKECPNCSGHGLVLITEHNTTFYSLGVKIKVCSCVRGEVVGKVPKRMLTVIASAKSPIVVNGVPQ